MKSKKQILIVHGGSTYSSRKNYEKVLHSIKVSLQKRKHWRRDYMPKKLKGFQCIETKMPLLENAKYKDWKVMFEKYLEITNKDIILMGQSLGGIFLAKYLSEHKLDKNIIATYLIAPPFDNTISQEELVGGFELKKDISLLKEQSKNLHLFFSKDDPIVTPQHARKFAKQLGKEHIIMFESKNGHFRIDTFPEIVKLIKKECK